MISQHDNGSATSIGAMDLAREVANEFVNLETGYRRRLYVMLEKSLTVYKRFLRDPASYKELLAQENIAVLREKPKLKETSRLVLYFLTNAQTEEERNKAGKYAMVVNYLHKKGVSSNDVVAYIQGAGGIDAILKKKARGHEALKATKDTQFNQQEKPDDADDLASSDANDDLFDAEQDASLRLGSEALALALSSEIPMNEVFYLECRKTGSIGRNWIRIVGRLFDPESE